MPNEPVKATVQSFQQKLASFKTKIEYQQLLAKSLAVEFESLTSEFESLKILFGASSPNFEVTSDQIGVTSINNEATFPDFEATSDQFGVTSINNEATSPNFEATSDQFGVTSINNEATSPNFEATSSDNGVTSIKFEASSVDNGASPPNDGASYSIRELVLLIRRAARESLRINYSQPNIPDRMAEIIMALKEKKKLSVAEMRQITGASRNTLVRDINVLKLLGWLEFHGSRKNGYFTLTAACPEFSVRKKV